MLAIERVMEWSKSLGVVPTRRNQAANEVFEKTTEILVRLDKNIMCNHDSPFFQQMFRFHMLEVIMKLQAYQTLSIDIPPVLYESAEAWKLQNQDQTHQGTRA